MGPPSAAFICFGLHGHPGPQISTSPGKFGHSKQQPQQQRFSPHVHGIRFYHYVAWSGRNRHVRFAGAAPFASQQGFCPSHVFGAWSAGGRHIKKVISSVTIIRPTLALHHSNRVGIQPPFLSDESVLSRGLWRLRWLLNASVDLGRDRCQTRQIPVFVVTVELVNSLGAAGQTHPVNTAVSRAHGVDRNVGMTHSHKCGISDAMNPIAWD